MNLRMLSRGRFCQVVCVVLSVALATGPTATVVAQQPVKTSKAGNQLLDNATVPVVEQPQLERTPGDNTLLAAPNAGKIDLTYVTPEAVALVTARPHQLLTSPQAAMFPVEVASAAGMKYLGFEPADVDDVVMFAELPTVVGLPFGGVVKFSKPFEISRLPEKLRAHTQTAELAGKQYLQNTQPQLPSFFMPDDRTLLVMPDVTLRKVLSPVGAPRSSPLLDRVGKLPGGQDLYAVVDVVSLRPLLNPWLNVAVMQKRDAFPAEARPYLEVPNLITAVELTLNLTTASPTSLVVRANDGASADRLEALYKLAKERQRKEMTKDVAKMQQSDDPVERAFGKYIERVSNSTADIYAPERQGDSLVLFQGFKQNSPVQQQLIMVAVTGILVALLLPAIQAAREAARRAQSMNNMKQLMIALVSYETVHRAFPAHANYSADGKPLLSWRVQILPYLDQETLYNQFKLDEPWDSEHNRKLIPLMPPAFDNPNIDEPGKTDYLALVGKECVMDGSSQGLHVAKISDGLSKTIVLVEADADQTVEWTKPDDWEFDPNNPSAGLGHLRPGGWLAAFADGHIQFISNDTDPATLKALSTRNGREIVTLP